jgi:hypothetical protein
MRVDAIHKCESGWIWPVLLKDLVAKRIRDPQGKINVVYCNEHVYA